jgi:hypothetical protein
MLAIFVIRSKKRGEILEKDQNCVNCRIKCPQETLYGSGSI